MDVTAVSRAKVWAWCALLASLCTAVFAIQWTPTLVGPMPQPNPDDYGPPPQYRAIYYVTPDDEQVQFVTTATLGGVGTQGMPIDSEESIRARQGSTLHKQTGNPGENPIVQGAAYRLIFAAFATGNQTSGLSLASSGPHNLVEDDVGAHYARAGAYKQGGALWNPPGQRDFHYDVQVPPQPPGPPPPGAAAEGLAGIMGAALLPCE